MWSIITERVHADLKNTAELCACDLNDQHVHRDAKCCSTM